MAFRSAKTGRYISRSAGTGRFVNKAAVKRWPNHTLTEQV